MFVKLTGIILRVLPLIPVISVLLEAISPETVALKPKLGPTEVVEGGLVICFPALSIESPELMLFCFVLFCLMQSDHVFDLLQMQILPISLLNR